MTAPIAAFFNPANAAGLEVAGRVSGEMIDGMVVRSAVNCDPGVSVVCDERVEELDGYLVGEGF